MADQPRPDRTLSEISHLFLSSVRERQTRGAPRPQRRPPSGAGSNPESEQSHADHDIDLTPEELAQVAPNGAAPQHELPAQILLAAHLGERRFDGARQYAAHLAASGARIGLIELDAAQFRLSCFELRQDAVDPAQNPSCATLGARRMIEALQELAHDIDQWVVLVPAPFANEARTLCRKVANWVLLASAKDDGIVSAYRAIKGLNQTQQRVGPAAPVPVLSMAVLDAPDDTEAARVNEKLAAVCDQFLQWNVRPLPRVQPAPQIAECVVLECRATQDKGQLASAPQWQVVSDFLDELRALPRSAPAARRVRPPVEPVALPPQPDQGSRVQLGGEWEDVIELPAGSGDPTSIVQAVLRGGGELVPCPVHPPMCPHACLAVSRDRRLVLVAVASQGLSDLRSIGQAYRWMNESRPLISMAMPQFAIDSHQLPRLHLLVDHADMSAEILQPLLQSQNVQVHAYRRLRWGSKTGLLLEAA
jgi:hypothetical protein